MKFKAGTYYVGDLCYVLSDRWDEFCDLTIAKDGVLDGTFVMKDGTLFYTHCTMYSDGTYSDQLGREYSVDAGLIGVVAIDDIDEDPNAIDGGNVITFDKAFECSYKDGVFYIGDITIDTGDTYAEECDEEYEEEEY